MLKYIQFHCAGLCVALSRTPKRTKPSQFLVNYSCWKVTVLGGCTIHIIAPGKSDSQELDSTLIFFRQSTTLYSAKVDCGLQCATMDCGLLQALTLCLLSQALLSPTVCRAVVPVITSSMAVITVEMVITILGTDFHCNFCKRRWVCSYTESLTPNSLQRVLSAISTQNGADDNLWG